MATSVATVAAAAPEVEPVGRAARYFVPVAAPVAPAGVATTRVAAVARAATVVVQVVPVVPGAGVGGAVVGATVVASATSAAAAAAAAAALPVQVTAWRARCRRLTPRMTVGSGVHSRLRPRPP